MWFPVPCVGIRTGVYRAHGSFTCWLFCEKRVLLVGLLSLYFTFVGQRHKDFQSLEVYDEVCNHDGAAVSLSQKS